MTENLLYSLNSPSAFIIVKVSVGYLCGVVNQKYALCYHSTEHT